MRDSHPASLLCLYSSCVRRKTPGAFAQTTGQLFIQLQSELYSIDFLYANRSHLLSLKILFLYRKIQYSVDGMYHEKRNRSPHQQVIAFPKAKVLSLAVSLGIGLISSLTISISTTIDRIPNSPCTVSIHSISLVILMIGFDAGLMSGMTIYGISCIMNAAIPINDIPK